MDRHKLIFVLFALLCIGAAPQQHHRHIIKTNKTAAGGGLITFVQAKSAFRSGFTNGFVTLDTAATAGNTLILCVTWETDTDITSVTDTQSRTYTLVHQRRVSNRSVAIYAVYGATGGTTTTTVAYGVATFGVVTSLAEFTNISAVDTTIAGADGTNLNNPMNAGNITPVANNTLLMAAYTTNAATGGFTVGTGYTIVVTPANNRQCWQYQILSGGSGVAKNTECTMLATARNWSGIAITLKQ